MQFSFCLRVTLVLSLAFGSVTQAAERAVLQETLIVWATE